MTSTLGLVLGLLIASSSSALADLIEADLFAVGDGLLTRDTDTTLEWLDLTQTVNMSVQDTIASTWYTTYGFTHATTAQIQTLMGNSAAGVTFDSIAEGPNAVGATKLVDLMGGTGGGTTFPFSSGLAGNGPSSGIVYEAGAQAGQFDSDPALEGFLSYQVTTRSDNVAYAFLGNYLVRGYTPVPEPTTLALLGMSIVGLAFARRRRLA